jgi:hypothetical protein
VVSELAYSGKTVLDVSPTTRVLALALTSMAVLFLLLGAYTMVSGRLPLIGKQGRLSGLAQLLWGITWLVFGLQPFMSLSWSLRTGLLAFNVVLTVAALILTLVLHFRARLATRSAARQRPSGG